MRNYGKTGTYFMLRLIQEQVVSNKARSLSFSYTYRECIIIVLCMVYHMTPIYTAYVYWYNIGNEEVWKN